MGFLNIFLTYLVFPLIALYVLLIIYYEYLASQRDIQDLALLSQSNISPTRKQNETAIYRNNQTPHGLPLITGLSVRDGFQLRNGNLKDWWKVLINQCNQSERIIIEDDRFGVQRYTIKELQSNISQLSQYFMDNSEYRVIGSTIPLFSYHSLIVSLACFTKQGLTYHHFTDLPRSQPDDVNVMICYREQLEFIKRLKYKLIIVIDSNSGENKNVEDNVMTWNQLASATRDFNPEFKYTFTQDEEKGFPFRQTSNSQTFSYTHQNFVSSCAAIVKSLPLSHELSQKDTLLITEVNDLNQWGKFMAVLLMEGKVILSNSDLKDKVDSLIVKYSPSIISVNEKYVEQTLFSHDVQPSTFVNSFYDLKISRAIHLLSEGIFTHSATFSPVFNSVRLTYISHQSTTASKLSSSDITRFRALTSTRAILNTHHPGLFGPFLLTNYYDYRVFSNDNLRNLGTVSLSLELKLRQVPGLDIEIDKAGEVCVRGFTVGTPYGQGALEIAKKEGELVGGEGWCPLRGVRGRFGSDGCFYQEKS